MTPLILCQCLRIIEVICQQQHIRAAAWEALLIICQAEASDRSQLWKEGTWQHTQGCQWSSMCGHFAWSLLPGHFSIMDVITLSLLWALNLPSFQDGKMVNAKADTCDTSLKNDIAVIILKLVPRNVCQVTSFTEEKWERGWGGREREKGFWVQHKATWVQASTMTCTWTIKLEMAVILMHQNPDLSGGDLL